MKVTVESKSSLADGVVGVELRSTSGGPLPDWEPGAHVEVTLAPGLVRHYSLCGVPDRRDRYTIAVLREAGGRGGSAYVHDRLDVGDEIEISDPANNFPLLPYERYVLVAGGIGVTPILSMARQLAERGAEVVLFYGGRSAGTMAYVDELVQLVPGVTLVTEDVHGHLPLDEVDDLAEPGTGVFACGPAGLLDALQARSEGWAAPLHVERFVPVEFETDDDVPFLVELKRSGLTLEVAEDETILEVVEDAGIEVDSSCEEGTCGTCRTRLLAGVAEHRDAVLSPQERESQEWVHICVSRALSGTLVLDL